MAEVYNRSINNPEELKQAIKKFQNIASLQLLENTSLMMKCPFQPAEGGTFHNCYLSNCMAFRHDNETFWCARLESKNKNKTAKYPPTQSLKDIK